ncbi:MAG: NAD(P)/FAD-dependent oxidoreductase [Chloroflexi bacterium]|nr:NAD(P)/FAD-dependent oxidoreductase [Chloroflexota bacterium]MCY3937293.1 NAD(P)/FAD-dependent oxidoreductase [Chloroflexota bacterium]
MAGLDVAIIGGGPAGSTLGTLLAQRGHTVAIFERERMPREHIGESLIPGCLGLLEQTGVLPKIESAGFNVKDGATYVWGQTRTPWTVRFEEAAAGGELHALQVDRAKFDKILLDHSRQSGVTVHENCNVLGPIGSAQGVEGLRVRLSDGSERNVPAAITVDASGQASVLGSRLGLRNLNEQLRHVALYSYWTGGKLLSDVVEGLSAKDAGNILIVAVDEGWLWHIPLAGDVRSVGLVTDADLVRGRSGAARTDLLRHLVQSTPEIALVLDGSEWTGRPAKSISDWSYQCRPLSGPHFLLVGDAACFVDPILSSGVYLAVHGAVRASLAIDKVLNNPGLRDLSLWWYESEYFYEFDGFVDLATHWYHGNKNRDSWFWKARALVEPEANLSLRQAFVYLSGGYRGERALAREHVLRPTGGFDEAHLQVLYDNLGADLGGRAPTVFAGAPPGNRAELSEGQVMTRAPDFVDGTEVTTYMQLLDGTLEPCLKISLPDALGRPRRLLATLESRPVFEMVDGRTTGNEIAARIASTGAFGSPDQARDFVAGFVSELHQLGVVTIA